MNKSLCEVDEEKMTPSHPVLKPPKLPVFQTGNLSLCNGLSNGNDFTRVHRADLGFDVANVMSDMQAGRSTDNA
jgi:hypothetical protein